MDQVRATAGSMDRQAVAVMEAVTAEPDELAVWVVWAALGASVVMAVGVAWEEEAAEAE